MWNWTKFSNRTRINNGVDGSLTSMMPLEAHSPVRGMKNAQEDPVETYRLLSCPICTTHDCWFHGTHYLISA